MVNTSLFRACVFVAVCGSVSIVNAQETTGAAAAAPVAQQPAGKADGDAVVATHHSRLTRTYWWAESRMGGSTSTPEGFYPELGGMINGAGLSVGPGFRHSLFGDRMMVDASAAISWRRYKMMQSQVSWPRLMNDRLELGGEVKYQDFTQVNFFGIGNDSLKSNRTDYRLKDIDTLGFATVRANPWLSITGRAGALRRVDIERGTSTLYPATQDVFDEISAPSLTREPNYLHADVAVNADTRDVPGYPTSGGRYRLSVAAYHDQTFGQYSFRRVEADAAQYIPIRRSVVALRARVDLSQTGDGQAVPFYLLPALGGANSLRGFLDYRFRDRDLLMLNAEYRWPIARKIDAAAFYDAGAVAPEASGLTRRFNRDYGLGVRVHSDTHMLVRLDVARSNEGTRALLTFTTPLALPNRSIAPYVP
jgi:outer membrane protein assembly factor BamA